MSFAQDFKEVFGSPQFELKTSDHQSSWRCTGFGYGFVCEPLAEGPMSLQLAVHELGHTLKARVPSKLNAEGEAVDDAGDLLREKVDDVKAERAALSPYGQLATTSITVEIGGKVEHVTGANSLGAFQRTELGYELTRNPAGFLSRSQISSTPLRWMGETLPMRILLTHFLAGPTTDVRMIRLGTRATSGWMATWPSG